MSDEETAFLGAIKEADPDEDTPRLVYADWLDEQGDRPFFGEAIRLDIESRNADKVTGQYRTISSMRNALRVRELTIAHAHEWFGFEPDVELHNKWRLKMSHMDAPIILDRGLVMLTGSIETMYHSDRLFPWVDGVRVTHQRGGAYKLMKLMEKTRLRRLAFHTADLHVMFDIMARFCRAVTREFEIYNLKHIDFGYSVDAAVLRELRHWDGLLVLKQLHSVIYGPRPYVGHGDQLVDDAVRDLVASWTRKGFPNLLQYTGSAKPRF